MKYGFAGLVFAEFLSIIITAELTTDLWNIPIMMFLVGIGYSLILVPILNREKITDYFGILPNNWRIGMSLRQIEYFSIRQVSVPEEVGEDIYTYMGLPFEEGNK